MDNSMENIFDLLLSGDFDLAAMLETTVDFDITKLDDWLFKKLLGGNVSEGHLTFFEKNLRLQYVELRKTIMRLFCTDTIKDSYKNIMAVDMCVSSHITKKGDEVTIYMHENTNSKYSSRVIHFGLNFISDENKVGLNWVSMSDSMVDITDIDKMVRKTKLALPVMEYFNSNNLFEDLLNSDEDFKVTYEYMLKVITFMSTVSKYISDNLYKIKDRVRKQKFIEGLKEKGCMVVGNKPSKLNSTSIVCAEIHSVNWKKHTVEVGYLRGKNVGGGYYDRKWIHNENGDIDRIYKLINHLVEI